MGSHVYPRLQARLEFLVYIISSALVASSTSVVFNRFVRGRVSQLVGFSGCNYALQARACVLKIDTQDPPASLAQHLPHKTIFPLISYHLLACGTTERKHARTHVIRGEDMLFQ